MQRVHPAFNFEKFLAVRPGYRYLNIRGARGILLDHPRIGIQASIGRIDALPASAVADRRGIDFASVHNDGAR